MRIIPLLLLALSAAPVPAGPVNDSALKPGDTFRDCDACPEMVIVPRGAFTMGVASEAEAPWGPYGLPPHRVSFAKPFAVGRFEVTFAEWDACIAAGGCPYTPPDDGHGRGRIPVFNVAWADAVGYAAWLAKTTGRQYRLLSEAEWEYVARAGTTNVRVWGDEPSGACAHANVHDLTSRKVNRFDWPDHGCDDGAAAMAPVGSYRANAFGVHDTFGNVWEWVEDCWHASYDGAPSDGSAWLADGLCYVRMVRGGSWGDKPFAVAAAFRGWYPAEARRDVIGFRIARPLDPPVSWWRNAGTD